MEAYMIGDIVLLVVFLLLFSTAFNAIHNIIVRRRSVLVKGRFLAYKTYLPTVTTKLYYPIFEVQWSGNIIEIQSQDYCTRSAFIDGEVYDIYMLDGSTKCFITKSVLLDTVTWLVSMLFVAVPILL